MPVVPPVVALPAVPAPMVSPTVPDFVVSVVVDLDVELRVRPRDFDTLCGSVDVVEPSVLVGEFA